jgi:glycosyltransferase involved in cell wall biosynthesis
LLVKFLLLNQFFAPDLAPTGQLLGDVVREIAAQGHEADVICAQAAYAGVGGGSMARHSDRVRVFRTRCLPFGHGRAARLLSYASFYAGALWQGLQATDCDAVVTMTTPPLLSLIGTLLKKLRGVRHYVWEMDLYPDVAVALGVLAPHSPITRVLESLATYSRRNADGVIVLGPCMRDRVAASGVPAAAVHIADNWADGALVRPRPFPPPGRLVVLYSGNLGLAHDIRTIAAAMAVLSEDDRFRFVFAGGGARRSELEEVCRSRAIANVSWLPYQERESLGAHLATCHVGLVTQTPASVGTLVPSKIYALMAAGRPLLFIGPREATAARIIERFQCGWQIEAGDSSALVELLRLLADSQQLAAEAGARARRAFIANYDLPAGVSTVLDTLGLRPARRPPASARLAAGQRAAARPLSA